MCFGGVGIRGPAQQVVARAFYVSRVSTYPYSGPCACTAAHVIVRARAAVCVEAQDKIKLIQITLFVRIDQIDFFFGRSILSHFQRDQPLLTGLKAVSRHIGIGNIRPAQYLVGVSYLCLEIPDILERDQLSQVKLVGRIIGFDRKRAKLLHSKLIDVALEDPHGIEGLDAAVALPVTGDHNAVALDILGLHRVGILGPADDFIARAGRHCGVKREGVRVVLHV